MFREASADYDKALRLGLSKKGDRLFAFTGRGYVSLMLENFEDAVGNLDRALDIDPAAGNALLWRAYAYERQGLRERALHDYERAAAAMPDNIAARDGMQRMRSPQRDSR
jgi:tetratricopeptide (TPR) repeat protein